MDRDKMIYVAESLPNQHWLSLYTVREVERKIRRFGISQKVAKTAIWNAKKLN